MLDISNLDYKALTELRERVDERIQDMRENGVPELRTRFSEAAAALGLSLDEILGKPKKKRGRPRAEPDDKA